MKILHLTPRSDGYEEVTLIANRYSRTNHLAVVEKGGSQFITGGIMLPDLPIIREALDLIPKNEQYEFCVLFKMDPFVKDYLND